MCRRCGKEGHIAKKCLSKPQNVNALDESLSDYGQETYHLFTLDTHSVRNVSVQKGKKVFPLIKLSAGGNFFVWKKLQLYTALTTNTLALDVLQDLCPAAFDTHHLIKPSSATLLTYGRGMIKPVGQTDLTCETQVTLHNLQLQFTATPA